MNRVCLNRLLSLAFLSLSCTLGYAAGNDESSVSASSENLVNVATDSNGTIMIEISIQDFDTIPVLIGSDKYYLITMSEGHSPLLRGNPDLPVITKSFIIPDNSQYTVRVVDESYSDYTIPVAPSLGSIRRNQSTDDVQIIFSNTYNQNSFYPDETVITGEPYYIRDIHGGNIQICPFKYNPITNTLRVYSYLKVEISFPGNNLRGALSNDKKIVNSHFYPLVKHKFINSDDYVRNVSESTRQGGEPSRSLDETAPKMLVVCCDSFVTEMRNFIIHKNNMGIPTTLVKMSDVGTTANHLKTYIQNAYNADNNLTYVLLVGDALQVPSPIAECFDIFDENTGDSVFFYGAGDPKLSLVDGNDNYPDIVIGRFSAETKKDVNTMVDRVILYENQLTSNWFHNGIGIADSNSYSLAALLLHNYSLNVHGYIEANWQHIRNIRDTLLNCPYSHYTSVLEFYEGTHGLFDNPGDPNKTDIINSINAGVSLINYAGHGLVNGWLTSAFTSNDVMSLNNQEKLPFVFSVACDVGKFNYAYFPCFAETWLRAQSASTGKPTGCIGFYGSSVEQWWNEPMDAQDSFNEQLVHGDYVTMGMLCYSAACEMMDNYTTGDPQRFAKDMFNTWILFGDPSLHIIPNNYVGRTLFLEGDIENDATYTKDFVDIHNATIKNNTDIIINHQQNTIFNGEFRVEVGSTLLVE